MSLRTFFGLFVVVALAQAQSFPYSPSVILRRPDVQTAYLFSGSASPQEQTKLFRIDLSQPIEQSTQFHEVSSGIPSSNSNDSLAFTSVIDASGNITVLTGNCLDGSAGIGVWRFVPDSAGGNGGNWIQFSTRNSAVGEQKSRAGVNYLAGAISFSPLVKSTDADTNIFTFGGMCPFQNSTPETWVSHAEYSNLMLNLGLAASTSKEDDYDVTLAMNRGPPIAEAGFSITPLSPTFSANSSGSPQTQQQNFVLLGGHTQTAFINMSQVAIWSLPQQGWTFLPVSQPMIYQVEPRSGHSAVLSADGKRIFVYGGWVGDTDTPAKPQFATLSIGTTPGGQSSWTWSVPSQSDSAPSLLYGHAATMLHGDVMMIYGGFTNGNSTSTKRAPTNQIMFYNTSSDSWVGTYTPPTKNAQSSGSSGPLSSTAAKAGLGVGIGVGVAVLVSLIACCIWCSRRRRRHRNERTSALLGRQSESSLNNHDRNLHSSDDAANALGIGPLWNGWHENPIPASKTDDMPQMMEQKGSVGASGLSVDVPSPTRGLRKKLGGRPYTYHAAPNTDENRLIHSSGLIHPIAELENEDGIEPSNKYDQERGMLNDAERKLRELQDVLKDPFADPSPDPMRSKDPFASPTIDAFNRDSGTTFGYTIPRKPVPTTIPDSAYNWFADERFAGTFVTDRTGRVSPTKTDDRTSSTLSERSQRSFVSTSSIARTMSAKTGAILAAAAARIVNVSADYSRVDGHASSSAAASSADDRSITHSSPKTRQMHKENMQRRNRLSDADSLSTTRSNFLQLQIEGQDLLGGRPSTDPDDPYQRAMAAANPSFRPTSISRYDSTGTVMTNRTRPSLLGSLRRAINAVATGGAGDRAQSLTSPVSDRYFDEKRATSTSPNKERFLSESEHSKAPRRAVSDGGALLRQKRGEKDWQDGKQWPPYRDDPDAGDWGEPRSSLDRKQAEQEWDVEGAAAQRDIQIMFSVPKARLRVVNADSDRVSIRSVSDGMISRSASIRHADSLHREVSGRSTFLLERNQTPLDIPSEKEASIATKSGDQTKKEE